MLLARPGQQSNIEELHTATKAFLSGRLPGLDNIPVKLLSASVYCNFILVLYKYENEYSFLKEVGDCKVRSLHNNISEKRDCNNYTGQSPKFFVRVALNCIQTLCRRGSTLNHCMISAATDLLQT